MINLQKIFRLQCFHIKQLRRTCFTMCSSCESIRSASFSSSNHIKTEFQVLHEHIPHMPYCTSPASSTSEEVVDFNVFDKVCEETLESLTEYFEELIESKEQFQNADVSYSGGVLTIKFSKIGTYVINRQTPNRQIWLSSPMSGPKRYDYVAAGSYWIYKHDMVPLHKLLQSEMSKILGEKVDFSKCLHAKV